MDRLSQADHYYRDSYDGSTCEISRQWYEEAKALLAEYEASGLTPAECAELARAKDEGRLVVLPCRVGDTVYSCQYGMTVFERKITGYRKNNRLLWAETAGGHMECSHFGKTVFLTREAAEAALAGRTEDAKCR